jgi:NitT/TauT family transport system ATP-binding protein
MADGDLILADLHFHWPDGSTLFAGLDLVFRKGEITAVVGESGCGKSTLLRLAAGLLRPAGGTVTGGAPLRSLVFQAPNLLPWRTVTANVGLPLTLSGGNGMADQEVAMRVQTALDSVGLGEDGDKLPHMLSGGMQMRAGLARALITAPDLLFMDEPFAALDALTRHRLQQEFLALWRAERPTVVLVTHDIDAAVRLSDRVVVLGGRPASVQADFTVDLPRPRGPELRHDPRTSAQIQRIEGAL